ncbi:hypothetical protein SORBI_3007G147901 [Sorghum bicolor]|uniref:Uncharacterized protein n=1 Tax=Sorghum bicolor TaxID=4558 RepID=A0A1Z5RAJ5_SORBI|nr:hypothetical protein SORBI_3007G147901 [Sorghum bicolor]
MNRLKKSSFRRGSGGRGTRPPSVHGPMTFVPAVGASATQSHATDGAAAVGVAVPVNTPAVSASPFGGWWPMSAPSEGCHL